MPQILQCAEKRPRAAMERRMYRRPEKTESVSILAAITRQSGHSITPKTSTGEMLYSLAYGTDAVIPVEVGEPSLRYSNESGPSNDESRLQDLDEVEERRNIAHIRMVAQKQQVERYYNKRAKVRPLKVGDCILKAKTQASKDPNEGKLGTNWDGPYKIIAATKKGAFQLETMEEKLLQNNWNVAHLKYFHF
ncbi:uncharacterized protein [Nicotiana sylvestris]|uniref:uncharacterized protein n=1 Tax=Nicotiana sylvestris TaxID=4096 RepID=UPI00388CAE6C